MSRRVGNMVQKEREDIVCRMKLEGWTVTQIAGYIGISASMLRGIVEKLKKNGRLPRRYLRGERNPIIGEGYSGDGKVRGR